PSGVSGKETRNSLKAEKDCTRDLRKLIRHYETFNTINRQKLNLPDSGSREVPSLVSALLGKHLRG
ncbi:MAG: hypothetical protein NWR09_09085, partial [Pseudomonadales bacterium]|nr:hypothetical protein [Pseudomonadales bacterium]